MGLIRPNDENKHRTELHQCLFKLPFNYLLFHFQLKQLKTELAKIEKALTSFKMAEWRDKSIIQLSANEIISWSWSSCLLALYPDLNLIPRVFSFYNMATAGMGAAILENQNAGDNDATSGMPVNLPGQLQIM